MPFKPGTSGNPKGRPTDAVRAKKIRDQILKATPEVVEGLISAAKSGDVMAGRTLLACACPPLKPAELPVTLEVDAEGSLSDQGRQIIQALAMGKLAPGQASAVLGGLSALARLIELDELDRRLTALEEQQ